MHVREMANTMGQMRQDKVSLSTGDRKGSRIGFSSSPKAIGTQVLPAVPVL